jgi:hypothetical protein
LLSDPAEKVNLADTNHELAKIMSAMLHRYTKEIRKTPINQQQEVLDKQLRQRLRSLGYVE